MARVTKAAIAEAQRAEVEFCRANATAEPVLRGRQPSPPDLIRAMLQAAYAISFPPMRNPPPRRAAVGIGKQHGRDGRG